MQVSILAYNNPSVQANSSPQPNAIPVEDAGGGLTVNKLTAQGEAVVDSVFVATETVTTSATETSLFGLVRINAAGGNITRTLPPAASSNGEEIFFKRTDSSGNTVTIAGNASELIDGANTNTSLSSQYAHLHLICNGTGWDIV